MRHVMRSRPNRHNRMPGGRIIIGSPRSVADGKSEPAIHRAVCPLGDAWRRLTRARLNPRAVQTTVGGHLSGPKPHASIPKLCVAPRIPSRTGHDRARARRTVRGIRERPSNRSPPGRTCGWVAACHGARRMEERLAKYAKRGCGLGVRQGPAVAHRTMATRSPHWRVRCAVVFARLHAVRRSRRGVLPSSRGHASR